MNIVFIFLGFLLLVVGGEFIVRSSVALSLKFNISKFVIGMTVVSFATSLPELIVSVNAALNNSPSIAINNVIGSNIANIGLVLGLISILGKITIDNYFYKRDWPWMFFFSLLMWFFISQDSVLQKYEGLILFLILIFFTLTIIKKSNYLDFKGSIDDELLKTSNFKIFVWLIISSITLYFGSEFLVDGAVNLAKQISISEAVISVTIVAIGTSVPELAASLVAIAKKEEGISVGNLIGSNIYNIGSVLGITAMIKEIPIAEEIIQRDIIWMLIFALIVIILAIIPRKNYLTSLKGLIMFSMYLYFIYIAFVQ
ncbi:MAG: calcium/sodium antiporter [Bacteroidota bacterium]|nr:calcium/sodium antiporter [Bacteroidota bacterium]